MYKKKGVVVFGINLSESLSLVRSWTTGKGLTYSILMDYSRSTWAQYGMGYIPHNVILDSTYTVRYTNYGYSESEQKTILDVIKTYLPKQTGVSDKSLPDNLHLIASCPNPIHDKTALVINLPGNQLYSLKIYDIFGRLIKTIAEHHVSNNAQNELWDRRDNLNRIVPAGLYFAVLSTPTIKRSIKLLVID